MALSRCPVLALLLLTMQQLDAQTIPACRLDNSVAPLVAETIERAATTYREQGKTLPFDTVVINKAAPP